MTKIQIPFKYKVIENMVEVEKIGYYEDDLSNAFKVCNKCFSPHDRNSSFCSDCSADKRDNTETWKERVATNLKLSGVTEAEFRALTLRDKLTLIWAGEQAKINRNKPNKSKEDATESKGRGSKGKVRKGSETVVQDNVQSRTKGGRRAKAGVV